LTDAERKSLLRELRDQLQEKSQHLVKNAWYEVDTGACKLGIHGITPTDPMHAFLHGVLHKALQIFWKYFTKAQLARIDELGEEMWGKFSSSFWDDEVSLRRKWHCGLTDTTQVTADEWAGICFVASATVLFSQRGRMICKEVLDKTPHDPPPRKKANTRKKKEQQTKTKVRIITTDDTEQAAGILMFDDDDSFIRSLRASKAVKHQETHDGITHVCNVCRPPVKDSTANDESMEEYAGEDVPVMEEETSIGSEIPKKKQKSSICWACSNASYVSMHGTRMDVSAEIITNLVGSKSIGGNAAFDP